MKVYIKFLLSIFSKSLFYVISIMFSLIFILNLLTELEFFKEIEVKVIFPILLSLLNSPSMIFEMLPFIFLISTQIFFIKLFNNNEIEIFKYSGLKNTNILKIFSLITIFSGIVLTIIFYNFSAIFTNFYLEEKTKFTTDSKYLAVITKNGLWIKDEINNQINFINAKKFSTNILNDVDIIQLNNNFEFKKNIKAEEVDIRENNWKLYNIKVIDSENNIEKKDQINFFSNFNYEDINNLFSNLSSLTVWNLFDLKKNYQSINYSTTEIDYHLQRILAYPFLITIITILSAILMLNLNFQKPKLFFIMLGILLSVIIY